jgi:glutathione S-transferase
MSSPPTVTLGYWKIRGLAQPIRTLLRYLHIPFADVMFEQGEAPSFSREAWLSQKGSLGLDFPNLPYLIDTTDASAPVRLTQSAAILRYIARKFGGEEQQLYAGSAARLAAVDCALEQAIDLRNQYTRVAYGSAPFDAFASTVLPGFLASFEAVVAAGGGGWLAPGAGPTIADFVLGEVLDAVSTMVAELAAPAGRDPSAFVAFPAVAAYKARFDALTAPARASPDNMLRPYNNKVAVWK